MQTQTLGHISLLKYHSRSFWIVFHALEEVRLQVWPFILCSVSRLSMQHLGQQPGSLSQAPATFLFAFSYWLQAAVALQSGPHREIETETLCHLHPYIHHVQKMGVQKKPGPSLTFIHYWTRIYWQTACHILYTVKVGIFTQPAYKWTDHIYFRT